MTRSERVLAQYWSSYWDSKRDAVLSARRKIDCKVEMMADDLGMIMDSGNGIGVNLLPLFELFYSDKARHFYEAMQQKQPARRVRAE